MKDDLLEEAARALRRETEADDDSGKFTRARVMATLHQSTVKRRTRMAFILPLAASFAAATAWGTVSGKAPEIARTVVEALGFDVAPAPPPSSARRPQRSKAQRTAPTPAESAPVAPLAPPPLEAPAPPAPVESAPAPRAVAPSGEIAQGGARAVERDPAHDLYRAAHRTHFVDQDCTRAVDAWSAYLRAAPGGRFAPEARYNRAICLVRLGKREAARSALSPFANGQYGTYRQKDAQALMDALDR